MYFLIYLAGLLTGLMIGIIILIVEIYLSKVSKENLISQLEDQVEKRFITKEKGIIFDVGEESKLDKLVRET